jgi:hypothetical protein
MDREDALEETNEINQNIMNGKKKLIFKDKM